MRYWLMKTEPETFSWDDHVAQCGGVGPDATKQSEWDGVRNPRARNNMMAMSVGDRAFFYHTGKARSIVGIVEVAAAAHPDSTDPGWASGEGRWQCVDVRPVRALERDGLCEAQRIWNGVSVHSS